MFVLFISRVSRRTFIGYAHLSSYQTPPLTTGMARYSFRHDAVSPEESKPKVTLEIDKAEEMEYPATRRFNLYKVVLTTDEDGTVKQQVLPASIAAKALGALAALVPAEH